MGMLAVAAPAYAQEQDVTQAAALDRKAREAFGQEDFAGAARYFSQAYDAAPHPATLYNVAMAWDQAGELARAADAYRRVLDEPGLDETRTEAAQQRLAELGQSLAQLRILEPKGGKASVAHLQDATIPVSLYLVPGSYDVQIVRPDGSRVRRTVEGRAGQSVDLVIEVATTPLSESPTRDEPSQRPSSSTAPPPVDDSTATWGWIALGSAAAFSGAATYLGIQTLGARDDFEDSNRLDGDERDRALRYRTWTNIAWGAAAVTGTVGVVLLLSGDKDGRETIEPAAAIRLTPTGAEATWQF